MSRTKKSETAIPIVEEKATVGKEAVETGRVRVRTFVDEHLERIAQDLERDDVTIERVPIDQEVTAVPQVREEGDVLIVPLVEEVIVVEKRLVVREELRIHRNRKRERVEEAVRLRRMRAEVDRSPPAGAQSVPPAEERRSTAPRIRRKEPLRERSR
jgi:uncharacterized protein (TIGR02271 family)